MLTRAVRRGDRYVLNGEKMWITNGSLADVAVVWAKGEDDRVRGFLIEKGTPGFKAWDVHGKLSLRASVTSGLSMTDCEIPAENLLPGVEGLRGPFSLLQPGALRDRLGSDWSGDGLLSNRAGLCEDAKAIRRTGRSPRTSSCRKSWPG